MACMAPMSVPNTSPNTIARMPSARDVGRRSPIASTTRCWVRKERSSPVNSDAMVLA